MTENETQPITPMTLEHAQDLLAEIVAEMPEGFRYVDVAGQPCFYLPRPQSFPSDDPRSYTGCIVGTLMRRSGRVIDACDEGLTTMSLHAKWNLRTDTALFLTNVQQYQDNGHTWADAVQAGTAYASSDIFRDELKAWGGV